MISALIPLQWAGLAFLVLAVGARGDHFEVELSQNRNRPVDKYMDNGLRLPMSTPAPNPRFAAIALKRQDGSNNCGYYDNTIFSGPWKCAGTLTCVTRGSVFGCGSHVWQACLTSKDPICVSSAQGAFTTCWLVSIILSAAPLLSLEDRHIWLTFSSITSTESNYPYCQKAVKFRTNGDSVVTLVAFACQNSLFDGIQYITDPVSSSTVVSSSASSGSSTTSATSTSTLPTISSTATSSPAQDGPPIGAIVGGVISGLLVVGLAISAIVWFLLRTRKRASAKGDDNKSGPSITNQPYVYSAVPPTGGTSEWQSPTATPMYEPYKSNLQSPTSDVYQHQSMVARSHSPDPIPASRSGALPSDYSSNRISEVPATNPAGTGNNASELPSDHIQRSSFAL
ncbi:hypothetical protein BDP55DRAFT_632400 [Colletotrichum godetiae]|uniref:Uncharacterized protein n=1 Tax=Colletotrichum godetiae TaxID=1209918 RepID=A0AAJ0AMR5_9PEZI|nr:uncharacterized protein BDP55DRAFT_632400 [Colletotrichum godetiae]KAK1675227.1 hypothetical protein BDP55DRAFT_632400 [Colletotrichum godetiae]